MTPKEYQELSEKTFAYFKDRTLENKTIDLLHCAMGASTETGELLDAFKKHIFYQKPLDVVNIGEEIADVQWYLFNLCRLLNLDMEELLENNIKKLKQRYGDKFSEEKALVRNLDKEREILEEIIQEKDYSKKEDDDNHLIDIEEEIKKKSEKKDRAIQENNGMKPPQHDWTIDDEKKKKILKDLRDNSLKSVNSKSLLEDFVMMFSFLEEENFELIKTDAQIEYAHKNFQLINLDDKIKKVKQNKYLLGFFKLPSGYKLVGLNFNPLLGEIKFDYAFGSIEGLSPEDKGELFKFLSSKKIKYNS